MTFGGGRRDGRIGPGDKPRTAWGSFLRISLGFHNKTTAGQRISIEVKSLPHSSIRHIIAFKMVSTRGHPQEFPEPDLTPSKSTPGRPRKGKWAHTPSNLAVVWLFISLPLVAWDTGYVLLRPLSMPGGSLHWPIWVPYDLYGTVDYIYGWKAFNDKNGFTAAQSFLNVIETILYIYYLYILYAHGRQSRALGRGAPKKNAGFLGQQRIVDGRQGALAVVVAYSAAVMTLSKTLLYCELPLSYFRF
jgi:hypothetical protein